MINVLEDRVCEFDAVLDRVLIVDERHLRRILTRAPQDGREQAAPHRRQQLALVPNQ